MIKIKNEYKIVENIVIIYIKNRKMELFEVLIDLDDFEKVEKMGYKLHAKWKKESRNYYIEACIYLGIFDNKPKYKTIQLHKFLTNTSEEYIVDHINCNTFDNRKENLRIVKKDENCSNRRGANINNSIGLRNITYVKKENVFRVQIMKKGIRYQKDFKILEEAIEYAENKRKELFGEFSGNR